MRCLKPSWINRAACALVTVVVAAVLSPGAAWPEAIEVARPAAVLPIIGRGTVDAEVLGVSVVPRSQGRRAVIVELRTDERITLELRVIRYQSVIARSKVFALRPGRWVIALPLAANVGVGRARALVRLADRAGHIARYRQPIRIPAPGN
jgi:hypothetical protein